MPISSMGTPISPIMPVSLPSVSGGGATYGGRHGTDEQPLPSAATAVLDDRRWAEQQADKQMAYQERLANTAYQRAMDDMRAAGLNPALAYQQGGAAAPTGALGQTSSTVQQASITRENNLFKTLNTVISGAFGLANSAIKVVK